MGFNLINKYIFWTLNIFKKSLIIPILIGYAHNNDCNSVVINNSAMDLSTLTEIHVIKNDSAFINSLVIACNFITKGSAPNKRIIIISDHEIPNDIQCIKLCRQLKITIESFSIGYYDEFLSEISNDYKYFKKPNKIKSKHLAGS